MSAIRLSVIMPTFMRAEILPRCLDAYLAQLEPGADELIVVDDGSTDATPEILRTYAARHPQVLRLASQPNAGPASARNRGLALAEGETLLFAGDDVIPLPGTVAAHLAAHRRHPQSAVLGRIEWHPELELTPLMRWLDASGMQFDYESLRDGMRLGSAYWYSSNLSIPRSLLPRPPVFDERFRHACWEDVDLGLRLDAAGVPLHFCASALGQHWHPMDLVGAVRRAERVGYYGAMLRDKHRLAPTEFRPLRVQVKRLLAPMARALPWRGMRDRGFAWTLEWPRYQGQRRFLREQRMLDSGP